MAGRRLASRRLRLRGVVLLVGLLFSVGPPPAWAQLLSHTVWLENQAILLRHLPGPAPGELATDTEIDGLYGGTDLTWGLGDLGVARLAADLGAVYDREAGETRLRVTVHRASLARRGGERWRWRVRGGIVPHRIGLGLLLDSDEPTLDLRLVHPWGEARVSALLQGLLIEGESPLVRLLLSLDGDRGHLTLWGGALRDRSNRLADQASAALRLAAEGRLARDPRAGHLSPRRLATLLDRLAAAQVVSDGRLWLGGLDAGFRRGAWSGRAVALYERGRYRFRGDLAGGAVGVDVAGWMVAGEATRKSGPLEATPFLLFESGDDHLVDRDYTAFVPITPFSPYAPLFFNGSLNRDFLADTYQPVELASFGVIATGLSLAGTLPRDLRLTLTPTYLATHREAGGEHDLGWEVDTALDWLPASPWSARLEWQGYWPGGVVDTLVAESRTVYLVALTVRYRF